MTDEERMEAMVQQALVEIQPYVDKVNKYSAMLADLREIITIIEGVTNEGVSSNTHIGCLVSTST